MSKCHSPKYLASKVDEKNGDYENQSIVSSASRRHPGVGNMPHFRKLLYGLLALIMVTVGLAAAVFPEGRPQSERNGLDEGQLGIDEDGSTFSKLLNSASPDTIHKLLHAYFPGTFRHGVYSSDASALEALRANDAGLATSIVQLAKRQNESTTGPVEVTTTIVTVSMTVTEPTTPGVTESSTTPPPVSSTTPPPVTTTPSQPSTTPDVPTTPSTTPPTTPPTIPPTDPPTSQTPTTTPPGTTPTSNGPLPTTSAPGSTTPGTTAGSSGTFENVPTSGASTSPLTTSLSTGTVVSSLLPSITVLSSSSGDTTLSTSTSSGVTGSVSRKTTTYTSTLPGGGLTTITAVEIVTGKGGSSPTADGTGSLQSGLAAPNYRGAVYEAMIGVVIGGALLV